MNSQINRQKFTRTSLVAHLRCSKPLLEKGRQLFLSSATACLATVLSFTSFASSSSDVADMVTPITYLLLDGAEVEDHEFGSLIPGKLYSVTELAFWRARAQSGPHVVRGDAYGSSTTGSVPDYGIIQGSALKFDTVDNDEVVLDGISRTTLEAKGLTDTELAAITFVDECAVLDPANSHTSYDWYEFGRFDLARDAAFVDLLADSSTHTNRIKGILLEQAQKPCIDFSNRNIFRNGAVNNNAFWLYLEWVHRALKAYDYLDDSAFSANEKIIIDNWFKGAAEWAYYYTSIYFVSPVYETRALNPVDSIIDLPDASNPDHTGYWLNRDAYAHLRERYEGSSVFWPAGSLINNRHLGQLNFVVHAGVKYDNDDWKKEGAQIVKEYVSFHFDDDGYYAELNRASDTSSQESMDFGIPVKAEHGLSYGANSLINIAEIAHILYLDGYENLFEYKSKARINEASGEIEVGTVEKSLEWVLLKFRQNFMLDNAPEIYPRGLTSEQRNTDTVIHFCANTHREKLDTSRVVGRMYSPSAIINRYYKNPLIKDIYNASADYGNLCGYADTDVEIRPGPHGVSPGTLFQYSDADEDY